MTDDRLHGKLANTERSIDDLIKTLTDRNADHVLVRQCMEHLHGILELLGERPTTRLLCKKMEKGSVTAIDIDNVDQK